MVWEFSIPQFAMRVNPFTTLVLSLFSLYSARMPNEPPPLRPAELRLTLSWADQGAGAEQLRGDAEAGEDEA